MSDDKAKFAHATSPGAQWKPCDVESEKMAAHIASEEWLHRATEDGLVVLVGRPDWKGPGDIAGMVRADSLIEWIDEKIWDEYGDWAPRIRKNAGPGDLDRLALYLGEVFEDWLKEIDFPPPFFQVPDWNAWRVTTLPDEEGGPAVEKIEEGDDE